MNNLKNQSNELELVKHFELEELEERIEFGRWSSTDGGRDETEIGAGVSNGWGEIGVRSGGAGDADGTGYIAIKF